MNTLTTGQRRLAPMLNSLALGVAALGLVACAASPTVAPEASAARQQLTQLQSNPKLAPLAPVALRDAEAAVEQAEVPREKPAQAEHYAYLAQTKVDYARAQAERLYLEQQQEALAAQREQVRLDARTAEADASKAEAERLRQQLADLNARQTERGIVMTLGDVLFETGKADLKPGATANLSKLVGFLREQPARRVDIEGHTDSVGSETYNQTLSQMRADSVRNYLTSQGIAPEQVIATGKGESFPVAPNDNVSGRQQNRRVEIIIANS